MKYNSIIGLELSISQECLEPVKIMISRSGKKETGGIIIGRYFENQCHAHIELFSKPPVDSHSGYFWFLRGNNGLKDLLLNYWNQGLYYLGEWHFHPFAPPNPSNQDLRQMKKIAKSKKYNCPEPILVIVGGSPDKYNIRAFVFYGLQKKICEFIRVE